MLPALQFVPADSVGRYQGGGAPKGAVMLIVLGLLYVLPTMLAFKRQSRRRWRIGAINLLAGWTGIGWIVAMVMTFAYEPPPDGEMDYDHVPGSTPG